MTERRRHVAQLQAPLTSSRIHHFTTSRERRLIYASRTRAILPLDRYEREAVNRWRPLKACRLQVDGYSRTRGPGHRGSPHQRRATRRPDVTRRNAVGVPKILCGAAPGCLLPIAECPPRLAAAPPPHLEGNQVEGQRRCVTPQKEYIQYNGNGWSGTWLAGIAAICVTPCARPFLPVSPCDGALAGAGAAD